MRDPCQHEGKSAPPLWFASGRSAALQPLAAGTGADDEPFDDVDSFCAIVGQLNWLTRTRPDLSYAVARLSSNLLSPKVGAARRANEAVTRAQETPFVIRFVQLTAPLRLMAYGETHTASSSVVLPPGPSAHASLRRHGQICVWSRGDH